MASDWLKMRIELQSHPKTVRILSATRTDKFRVIGGLHAVWSVFDTHSEDGKLKGYTPELMDQVIGWDGFSRAMESVGWLTFDGIETLGMPEFHEHNGQSAKRRAEDQKRKRDARRESGKECGQNADRMRTREREEKEKIKTKEERPADAELFPGVPEDLIRDFKVLRKTKKAAITPTAIRGIQREAAKANLSLEAAMRMCCERGWAGFKAEWVTDGKPAEPVRKRKEL